MNTKSYVLATKEEEEVLKGKTYYFGQFWNGDGDGDELLKSGAISPNEENIVQFEIMDEKNDILETLIKVIDIY